MTVRPCLHWPARPRPALTRNARARPWPFAFLIKSVHSRTVSRPPLLAGWRPCISLFRNGRSQANIEKHMLCRRARPSRQQHATAAAGHSIIFGSARPACCCLGVKSFAALVCLPEGTVTVTKVVPEDAACNKMIFIMLLHCHDEQECWNVPQ